MYEDLMESLEHLRLKKSFLSKNQCLKICCFDFLGALGGHSVKNFCPNGFKPSTITMMKKLLTFEKKTL